MNTEKFWIGRRLGTDPALKEALGQLDKDLLPDDKPQDASPEYRKKLAQSLLYKFILDLVGDEISPELRSGGSLLHRPISKGEQHYDENKEDWPVGKPIPKLESNVQVSGIESQK